MIPVTVNPIDSLQWLASTVWMEAEGESYEGKLAVAFCIANRAQRGRRSISDVVLTAWQFSAWNTDSTTRMKLDALRADDSIWLECVRAAVEALFNSVPDPITGRTLYMNEAIVLRARGSLPEWWTVAGGRDPGLKIGAHTFRFDVT